MSVVATSTGVPPKGPPVPLEQLKGLTTQPPASVCPPNFYLAGFPGQPKAFACLAPSVDHVAGNETQPLCEQPFIQAAGLLGIFWSQTKFPNLTCPDGMIATAGSMATNPINNPDTQTVCFFPGTATPPASDPRLSGFWSYCYFWPSGGLGYGFTFNA